MLSFVFNTKITLVCFIAFLLLNVNSSAFSSGKFDVSGALRGNYSSSSKHLDDISDLVGMTFQLKTHIRFSRNLAAKFEGRVGSDRITRRGFGNSVLQQGFLQFRSQKFDISAGKQIIAWGKADAVNPTDVLSPRNYTTSLPFDEDQREGAGIIKGDYYFDAGFSASLITILDHEPSTLFFPVQEDMDLVFDKNVDVNIRRPQWAFRINHYSGDLDWSIYYFDGYSLLPQANGFDHNQNLKSIHLNYPQITMYGADLAGAIGRYSYRLEFAAYRPENNHHNFGMPSYSAVVGGVERVFGQYLNVNFQYVGRKSEQLKGIDSSDVNMASQVIHMNKFITSLPKKYNHGMTFRISNTWLNETLQAELFVNHHFVDNSTYLQSMLKYDIQDGIKLSLGVQKYYGEDNSLFGVLKKNNNIFLELRYSF